ncbi:hypothetical protein AB2S62_21750 [Vibrio sp. NTOU-M3]
MKDKHKTMLLTVLATLIIIALINNVSMLEALKEQINGKSGWF